MSPQAKDLGHKIQFCMKTKENGRKAEICAKNHNVDNEFNLRISLTLSYLKRMYTDVQMLQRSRQNFLVLSVG